MSNTRVCPNCGEVLTKNGHYVPPSFGEDGFYICKELKKLDESKKLDKEK